MFLGSQKGGNFSKEELARECFRDHLHRLGTSESRPELALHRQRLRQLQHSRDATPSEPPLPPRVPEAMPARAQRDTGAPRDGVGQRP